MHHLSDNNKSKVMGKSGKIIARVSQGKVTSFKALGVTNSPRCEKGTVIVKALSSRPFNYCIYCLLIFKDFQGLEMGLSELKDSEELSRTTQTLSCSRLAILSLG